MGKNKDGSKRTKGNTKVSTPSDEKIQHNYRQLNLSNYIPSNA